MGNKESKPLVYRRDSFDCRITDYLCEILLSYLSFEDKIRFECISKQFKDLVFNKQYVMNQIGFNGLPQLWYKSSSNPNLKAREKVLIKCKAINSFETYIMTNELAKLLIKYCNHLKRFKSDFSQINIQVMISFGQKFGQSLRQIGFKCFLNNNEDQSLMKSLVDFCPKLKSITGIQFNHFIDKNNFKHFKNLSEIRIDIEKVSDIDLFDLFINNYKNQLKSIEIGYLIYIENEYIVYNLLINLFKSIATEFTQLTEFSFIKITKISDELLHEIFAIISRMVNIEKLELILFEYNINPVLQYLYSMKQLIQLKLHFLGVTDDFFTDIHKHFPKLKSFKLSEFEYKITNKTLKSLSKLENIETVVMNRKVVDLNDDDLFQFINECKKIRVIDIETKHEISGQTIEAIISLALRKPELKFKFKLNFGNNLQQFEKNVPKNARFVSFN